MKAAFVYEYMNDWLNVLNRWKVLLMYSLYSYRIFNWHMRVFVFTGHVIVTPIKTLHKPHKRDILEYNCNWIFNTNRHPECFIVNTKTCFNGVWLQSKRGETPDNEPAHAIWYSLVSTWFEIYSGRKTYGLHYKWRQRFVTDSKVGWMLTVVSLMWSTTKKMESHVKSPSPLSHRLMDGFSTNGSNPFL